MSAAEPTQAFTGQLDKELSDARRALLAAHDWWCRRLGNEGASNADGASTDFCGRGPIEVQLGSTIDELEFE